MNQATTYWLNILSFAAIPPEQLKNLLTLTYVVLAILALLAVIAGIKMMAPLLKHKRVEKEKILTLEEPQKTTQEPIPEPTQMGKATKISDRQKKTRKEKKKILTLKPDKLPASPIDLVPYEEPKYQEELKHIANELTEELLQILREFGIKAELAGVNIGPRVIRCELKIPRGMRVEKITRLSDDIATHLGVRHVRIEYAIPGKANTVAIEIPHGKSVMVPLGYIVHRPEFKEIDTPLPLVLGLDVSGKPVVEDLRKQPHLLIAGATGSGKSVCINTLITGILLKSTPDMVKFILVDPKRVELKTFGNIPHLLFPIITESDEAVAGLDWAIEEMERRYSLLEEHGVRNIESFNRRNPDKKLPYIVIVIDELADLMSLKKSDVESKIFRLAQLARASGIHLILATQRPSTDVITGTIKANLPARISFAVSSGIDSRVILDAYGAEKLLGKGDMLYISINHKKPLRIQGAYTKDEIIQKVINYWRKLYPDYKPLDKTTLEKYLHKQESDTSSPTSEEEAILAKYGFDPKLGKAWKLFADKNRVSITMLRNYLYIGHPRAARMVEQLEDLGIITTEGSKKKLIRRDIENLKTIVEEHGPWIRKI